MNNTETFANQVRVRPSAISHALRVIRDHTANGAVSRVGEATPPAQRPTPFPIRIRHDGIRCGDDFQYLLSVAGCLVDRKRAWRLAYEVYRGKGYAEINRQELWYGRHDALPRTVTFLAAENGEPKAAVTLVFDSAWGLPADEICRPDVDKLRAEGRRLCELVSLVSTADRSGGVQLVKHLFKLAYITAYRLEQATDFLVTVNPRHAPFYERGLLFERLTDVVACRRVNEAPAVLLRLDMLNARQTYKDRFDGRSGSRNLFRFFLDRAEDIAHWVRTQRVPLDSGSLHQAFSEERSLLTDEELAQVSANGIE